MRRPLPSALGLILVIASSTSAAVAQPSSCIMPTTNEWLMQGDSSGPVERLHTDRVRPVSEHVPEAIAKLATRSAVPLTNAEVRRFTGKPSATVSRQSLRPFLVRAVYPTPHPTFDLGWDGTRLDVFAGGLGCAPYVKHPIIVFLERKPHRVFVMASAAL